MASRPRILFFAHSIGIGGIERSLVALLAEIPFSQYEIHLLLLDTRGEFFSYVPKEVKILSCPASYNALARPIRDVLFSKNFLIGLARLIARAIVFFRGFLGLPPGDLLARSHRYALCFLPPIKGEYDCAISFWEPHDIVAEKINARKKIAWIHTDYTSLENGTAARFEEKPWEKMDKIAAVSSGVAIAFAKIFPDLANRTVVIENLLSPTFVRSQGADNYPPKDIAVDKDCLILCSAGRYTYQKAFDLAALACRKLLDAGIKVRWYILGYGPDEPLLRKIITENKLEDSFILLGKRTNPYPYMKVCDIYVQPSRYEGKAVAVREAQMLGKPVLISDFATAGSQLEHNVDGYIAEAGVDGLVRGIQLLASNTELRNRLAKTAASRDYGNIAEAEKIYKIIRD